MRIRGALAERGQAAPLLALLVVVAGGAALFLARFGGLAVGRAKAEAAADAAALAGAGEGREAAERLASTNGARLTGYDVDGSDTQVVVELGDGLVAVARARRLGSDWGDGSGEGADGLAPAMQAALARAEQLLGRPVPITSGYRSPAQQAALWANRASNPYPVARPGTSMHERGLAIDVPLSFVPVLRTVAAGVGLCQPAVPDPIHFEVCRWNPRE